MRKLFALAIIFASLFVSATPAWAEHGVEDFFSKQWLNGVTRNYCVEDFDAPLTDGEYDNMRATTSHQFNIEIETVNNVSTNWQMLSGQCSSNLEFNNWDCNAIGFTYPNLTSRISYDDLDPGVAAATLKCDLDQNGNWDFFWIAINDSGFDFHWDYSVAVPWNDWDYAGVVLHEMAHAVGWNSGHWTGSSMCPISSAIQTMCTGVNHGVYHDGNSSGAYWRTLESHDSGEIAQAYA